MIIRVILILLGALLANVGVATAQQFISEQGIVADLLRQADMHMRRANFPEALELYNQAQAHDQGNALIYVNRARLLSRLGRSADALADIQQANELNPYTPFMLDERARIRMFMADYQGAANDLLASVRQFPQDSLLITDAVEALLEANMLDSALDMASRLITLYPTNYVALANRAAIWLRLNRADRAEIDLAEANALNPDCAVINDLFGQVNMTKGVLSSAMEYFDRAIKLNPELGSAYVNKAMTYKALGDTTLALEWLNKGLAVEFDLAHAYLNRALAKRALGDATGAIEDLKVARKLDPENAQAIYNLGLIRKHSGDRLGALDEAERLVKLHPRSADSYNLRGSVYAIMNDLDRAIADFDRALQLDPDHHIALHNRGAVRIFRNQQAMACEDFRQSAILGNSEAQRKHEAFCSIRW